MIRDLEAFRRLCERERWDRLSRMSVDETIAVGEALLTSELMRVSPFPRDDHPVTLARALGIKSARTSS
jgi:hypothetical protein